MTLFSPAHAGKLGVGQRYIVDEARHADAAIANFRIPPPLKTTAIAELFALLPQRYSLSVIGATKSNNFPIASAYPGWPGVTPAALEMCRLEARKGGPRGPRTNVAADAARRRRRSSSIVHSRQRVGDGCSKQHSTVADDIITAVTARQLQPNRLCRRCSGQHRGGHSLEIGRGMLNSEIGGAAGAIGVQY